MNLKRLFILIILLALATCQASGCSKDKEIPDEPSEEPTVLDEGSQMRDPGYFIDDEGRVIYDDSRVRMEDGEEAERNPDLAPIFPGSQRIYPAGEDPFLRESHITRAPYEAIEQFYTEYLAYGKVNPGQEKIGEGVFVNTVSSEDDDGRRQTALFVNDEAEARAGMKVMLKEFPAQHAVQIILTTLEATPPGLNPMGVWVTPDEAEAWAEEVEKQEEEEQKRREEAEAAAVDGAATDSGDGSGDGTTDDEGAE